MKKIYKLSVIGDVGQGEPVYNGQTAKTRDYIFYLSKRYGNDRVNFVDTRYWKKKIFIKIIRLLKAMFNSESLILVLGKNGRRTILPFSLLLRRLFKNQVLFSLVGGSLMYDYDEEAITRKCLRKVDATFVETKMFQDFLIKKNISNVYYAPVFSKRKGIKDLNRLEQSMKIPYRFCTYSRVCKEKGISIAIDSITQINKKAGKVVCTLDIYGVPQEDYKEEFEKKVREAHNCVFVWPYLDDSNAIDTLSQHYVMLFPTFYSGEGFPIAIIECLKAGLPVFASDWHFNKEVVIDGYTGKIFDLNDKDGLDKIVEWSINNSSEILKMKKNCLNHAKLFEPDNILNELYKFIDRDM